jgi:hypothetical protein
MRLQEILSTRPRKPRMGVPEISSYIQTVFECADACLACADACLAEENVQDLVRCIRINTDCAEICEVTGKLLSRQTEADSAVIRAQLQACLAACQACAEECDKHAQMHEHCRICALACRECEEACMKLMAEFPVQAAGMA